MLRVHLQPQLLAHVLVMPRLVMTVMPTLVVMVMPRLVMMPRLVVMPTLVVMVILRLVVMVMPRLVMMVMPRLLVIVHTTHLMLMLIICHTDTHVALDTSSQMPFVFRYLHAPQQCLNRVLLSDKDMSRINLSKRLTGNMNAEDESDYDKFNSEVLQRHCINGFSQ